MSGISILGKFHKVDWPPIPRFLVEKRRREKTEIAPAPLTMISSLLFSPGTGRDVAN